MAFRQLVRSLEAAHDSELQEAVLHVQQERDALRAQLEQLRPRLLTAETRPVGDACEPVDSSDDEEGSTDEGPAITRVRPSNGTIFYSKSVEAQAAKFRDKRSRAPQFASLHASETSNQVMLSPVSWAGSSVEGPHRRRTRGSSLTHSSASTPHLRDNAKPQPIELQPFWFDLASELQNTTMKDMPSRVISWFSGTDPERLEPGMLHFLVLHPAAKLRFFWDSVALLFILYDTMVIPLQVFELQFSEFLHITDTAAAAYWTFDICMSFCTGYYTEGIVEMNPGKIVRRYLRTWFSIDVLLSMLAWLPLLISGVDRSIKLLQSIRAARVLRLIRLLKAQAKIQDIIDRVRPSEHFMTVLGVAKLVIFVVSVSHYIACGWYGLASARMGKGSETWIEQHEIQDQGTLYHYTTSLHWSLTQFTPASMEVFPHNSIERSYNICVLIFALVTFSSVVSSITAAMNHLQSLDKERVWRNMMLRRYLHDNQVHSHLASRIWNYLEHWSKHTTQRRLYERDVAAINVLPQALQQELRTAIRAPVLEAHPLFSLTSAASPGLMKRICFHAVKELAVTAGHEIFVIGDPATCMYFVRNGFLQYHVEVAGVPGMTKIFDTVQPNQWLSEAVLWVKWVHRGQLVGTKSCDVIALEAERFHKVVRQEISSAARFAKYAALFADYAEQLHEEGRDFDLDLRVDGGIVKMLAHHAVDSEEKDMNLMLSTHLSNNSNDSQNLDLESPPGEDAVRRSPSPGRHAELMKSCIGHLLDAHEDVMWTLGSTGSMCASADIAQTSREIAKLKVDNDALQRHARGVNHDLEFYDHQLRGLLAQLWSRQYNSSEAEQFRAQFAGIMRGMEEADGRLAGLRETQFSNIETLGIMKGCQSCSKESERVQAAIRDAEAAMRSGNASWRRGRRCAFLAKLRSDISQAHSHEASEASELKRAADDIEERAAACHQKLSEAQSAAGDTNVDEVQLQLLRIAGERHSVALRQSLQSTRQVWMHQHLVALRLAQRMLDRQAEVEELLRNGNEDNILMEAGKVQRMANNIQKHAQEVRDRINQMNRAAMETQAQLKEMEKCGPEESSLRDRLLMHVFELRLEDTRLAWLRKEQLQCIDHWILLGKAVAEAEGCISI